MTAGRHLAPSPTTPLLWLALVMVEPSGALTVNTRAPIVINPHDALAAGDAARLVYPLRHVLIDAEC
jgi:flagellar assembly factor FliW